MVNGLLQGIPHTEAQGRLYIGAIAPFTYANLTFKEAMLDLGVRFILNCPQEDISTSSRLMFQVEEAHWFYEDFAREQNTSFPSLPFPGFIKSLFKQLPVLKVLCEDYHQAYADFKEYKKGIPVRGVIMFNDKYDKVLMVRAWKSRTWGFPRGKINKEEDDKVCAVREVMEETGFDPSPYLDGDFYAEKTIMGKNFRFYFAGGVPESTIFETRTRKEIDEIKWIPISELKSKPSRKDFYLVTQFIRPIEKFSRSKRGYSSDLSQKESNALKSILGVSNFTEQTIKNDVESAQQLLAMLRPPIASDDTTELSAAEPPLLASQPSRPETESPSVPPSNADRQILLNLLKESTPVSAENEQNSEQNQVEGAKQILALLKREMSSQTPQSTTNALDSPLPDIRESPVSAPMLPPNSMLEQLVSSRKLHPSSKPNLVPRRRENIPRNRLLDILHSSTGPQTKLIDLLAPPKTDSQGSSPYSSSYESSRSNPLISLLDDDDSTIQEPPIMEQPKLKDAEFQSPETTSTSRNDTGGNALLSLLNAPPGANDTNSHSRQNEREARTEPSLSDKNPSDKNPSDESLFAAKNAPESKQARPSPPSRGVRKVAKTPEKRTASTKESRKGHRVLQSATSLKNISAQTPEFYRISDSPSSGVSIEKFNLLDRLSENAYYDSEPFQETEKLHQVNDQEKHHGGDPASHAQASSRGATLDNNITEKKSHKDASCQGEKKQLKIVVQGGKNNKPKHEKQSQAKQPHAKQSRTKQVKEKQRPDESGPHCSKPLKEISKETTNTEGSPAQIPQDRSLRNILAGNPLLSLLSRKSRSAQPPQQDSMKSPILKQSPGGSLLDLLKLD